MTKILFVEDNPHFGRVISFLLKRAGNEVTHCLSGEKALEAINNNAFECVITDYRMAHISGLNVAEISRCKWPDIPIFLMTAIPPDLLDPKLRKIVDEIFIKPVSCDEFIDRVHQCLNQHNAINTNFERNSLSENPSAL